MLRSGWKILSTDGAKPSAKRAGPSNPQFNRPPKARASGGMVPRPGMGTANSKKKTFPCPYNLDPLSCFQTVIKMIEWMPSKELRDDPGDRHNFFCQPASGPQLKKWKADGMPWKLNPHSSKVVGPHLVNAKLVLLAKMCGYTNFQRNTAYGKRRGGIFLNLPILVVLLLF